MTSPEELIKKGTDAMGESDWFEAVKAFEHARDLILEALKKEDSSSESTHKLQRMLRILVGSEEPGDHGRLAMAKDYRQRIAGLKTWMQTDRLPKRAVAETRKETFQKARYELALSPLSDPLKDAAVWAIQDIIGSAEQNDAFFKVSEVVFAYIVRQLLAIDPSNEEERIDFSTGLEHDPSFLKERRASRGANPIAVQDRIIRRYQKVYGADFAQHLMGAHHSTFIGLSKAIDHAIRVVTDDDNLNDFGHGLFGMGVKPPDLKQ